MANWKDVIRNHPAHDAVKLLHKEFSDDEGFEFKDTDDYIARLTSILEKAIKLLTAGDVRFVPKQSLEVLQSAISSIRPQWNSLKAQRTAPTLHEQYLNAMDPYLDQILSHLAQIRSITTPISKESAFDKLGNIKLDADSKIREIEAGLQIEVEELSGKIDDLEKDSAALTTSINEEKARADSLITQFQTTFNDGQKERDEKFKQKLEKEYVSKLNQEIDGFHHRFDALEDKKIEKINHLDSETERLVEQLESHVKKAGLVAQSIAEKAIQSQYAQNAADEKREASKWANITLGISAALIIIITFILVWAVWSNQPVSPETFLPKALILVVLVGVARWTAKMQRSHTEEARNYKQLSLELETIAPFIATLPEDEQRAVTRVLVDRYFVGRTSQNQDQAKDQDDSFNHPTQQIGDTIKKLYAGKDGPS